MTSTILITVLSLSILLIVLAVIGLPRCRARLSHQATTAPLGGVVNDTTDEVSEEFILHVDQALALGRN